MCVHACCDSRAGKDSSRVRMVRSPWAAGLTVTREEALDVESEGQRKPVSS